MLGRRALRGKRDFISREGALTTLGPSPTRSRASSWFPLLWAAIIVIFILTVIGEFFGESQDWQNYVNFFDALRASGTGVGNRGAGRAWIQAVSTFINYAFAIKSLYLRSDFRGIAVCEVYRHQFIY